MQKGAVMPYLEIGAEVKRLRLAKGLTLRALEAASGIHNPTLAIIESGERALGPYVERLVPPLGAEVRTLAYTEAYRDSMARLEETQRRAAALFEVIFRQLPVAAAELDAARKAAAV